MISNLIYPKSKFWKESHFTTSNFFQDFYPHPQLLGFSTFVESAEKRDDPFPERIALWNHIIVVFSFKIIYRYSNDLTLYLFYSWHYSIYLFNRIFVNINWPWIQSRFWFRTFYLFWGFPRVVSMKHMH